MSAPSAETSPGSASGSSIATPPGAASTGGAALTTRPCRAATSLASPPSPASLVGRRSAPVDMGCGRGMIFAETGSGTPSAGAGPSPGSSTRITSTAFAGRRVAVVVLPGDSVLAAADCSPSDAPAGIGSAAAPAAGGCAASDSRLTTVATPPITPARTTATAAALRVRLMPRGGGRSDPGGVSSLARQRIGRAA